MIRKLRQLGFEGPFAGGRHLVMRHPQTRVKISIPMHPSHDIPKGTLRAILRAAGVTIEEWANL
ncbi:MAG: type II toxin-antitoxin system HicA family toxin [Candidatus Bipolaricaulia bacterium]